MSLISHFASVAKMPFSHDISRKTIYSSPSAAGITIL